MANPIASGGPTALGRPARAGYQDSSRKGVPAEGAAGALVGKQRERAAGTMPAACPTPREIHSDPIHEAFPPARGPDPTGPGFHGHVPPVRKPRHPRPHGAFPPPTPQPPHH